MCTSLSTFKKEFVEQDTFQKEFVEQDTTRLKPFMFFDTMILFKFKSKTSTLLPHDLFHKDLSLFNFKMRRLHLPVPANGQGHTK
jgi:hypothetical protein